MSGICYLIDAEYKLHLVEPYRNAYRCAYPQIPLIKSIFMEFSGFDSIFVILTLGGRVGIVEKRTMKIEYLLLTNAIAIYRDKMRLNDPILRFLMLDGCKKLHRIILINGEISDELLDVSVDNVITTKYDGYACIKNVILCYNGMKN